MTELEQRLAKQIELARASTHATQLQEQLGTAPVGIQEEVRGPADNGQAAANTPQSVRPAPARGSTSVALERRRKRHRSPSDDTSSEENSSKRRRHRGIKPKKPAVYTAKNLREYNEWLLDVENVFTIMRYEYRHDPDKVAYAQ